MILREYSVCSGFPCSTVSSIQERKGDSFLISVSLTQLSQNSRCSRFRRQKEQQNRSPRLPPFCSASFREGRVALSVGHPRETHSRYVIGCCLSPLRSVVLKITRDELPMEQGVYGGCPLCPLYSLLIVSITQAYVHAILDSFCPATKIIPDMGSVHKQECLWPCDL